MIVFRLSRKRYAHELSGVGAARSGNRWNSRGTEIIYTSQSRALAMAEVAVHLNFDVLPVDFAMMEIMIPDDVDVLTADKQDLPTQWSSHPPIVATQKMGDDFIFSRLHCVLRVPSAVVSGDYNFLINPAHGDFERVTILSVTDFPFDQRLFK